jgi:hypothetical protein
MRIRSPLCQSHLPLISGRVGRPFGRAVENLPAIDMIAPIASSCTGMCWDVKPGQAKTSPASREGFSVAGKLRIEKAFALQKTDSGWRCNTPALQPVDFGVALSGP